MMAVDAAKRSIDVNGGRKFKPLAPYGSMENGSSRHAEEMVTVLNSLGLHASSSAKLVKEASKYSSEITLTKEDMTVNVKSIMGVLMLGATQGTHLIIKAVGDDARNAVDNLVAMFNQKFDEE